MANMICRSIVNTANVQTPEFLYYHFFSIVTYETYCWQKNHVPASNDMTKVTSQLQRPKHEVHQ